MAKKKNTLGKLLAFTTTVAAIGGACYIYRDKIKQSSIYKTTADKCSDLYSKFKNKMNDEDYDDFFPDDEEEHFDNVFTEEEKQNREYTSITINPKDKSEAIPEDPMVETAIQEEPFEKAEAVEETEELPGEEAIEAPEDLSVEEAIEEPEVSIPTISFETSSTDEVAEKTAVTAYEYEGLSDVSEDPEVLEEQDQLDF